MIVRVSQHSIFIRCLPGFNQNTNEPDNVLVWNKCFKLKWHGRKQIIMATSFAALFFSCDAQNKIRGRRDNSGARRA